MSKPLVSIIIPVFNRVNVLTETLDSILAQTYINWECILIDDGSNDGSFNLIEYYQEKDSRFKVNKRPINRKKGANACRNYGIEKALGDYFIFFDSDDLFVPNCLENRINYIHNSKYDMVIFSMGIFNNPNKLTIPDSRIVYNNTLDNTIKEFVTAKSLPWNICRPIIKASLIKNKVWFNKDLMRFQDVEFNIKILKKCQPNFICIDETDMYYRLENKYLDEGFILKLFPSLFVFYKSIFSLLSKSEKKDFRLQLVSKLFVFVKEYGRPFVPLSDMLIVLKLFKAHLNLSAKETITLYSAIILNKFYFRLKGYDRMYTFLKTSFN